MFHINVYRLMNALENHITTAYMFYVEPPSVKKREDDLLVCSKCLEEFSSPYEYFKHMLKCAKNYKDDIFDYANYVTNAYLLAQYKLSQLCGALTDKKFTKCTLCKKSFENEEALKVHVKTCKHFSDNWEKFQHEIDDWATILSCYHEKVYKACCACADRGSWEYRIRTKQELTDAREKVFDALPGFFEALFIRYLEKNKAEANFMSSKESVKNTVHLAFLKNKKGKEKIEKDGNYENSPQLAEDVGDAISNFSDDTDIDDCDGYWYNSDDEECDDDFCDSEDDFG